MRPSFSRRTAASSRTAPGIRDALLSLPCKSAIIAGKVVACKEDGTPDFRALHSGNYTQEILCVWAFELMEPNGQDLRPIRRVARKGKLDVILRRHDQPYVRHSEPFKAGAQLCAECRRRGLEGIVSKRKHYPSNRANATG
jgi:ATP-dependent DNA ligase